MTAIITALICISIPLFMITTGVSTYLYINSRKKVKILENSTNLQTEQFRQYFNNQTTRLIADHQQELAAKDIDQHQLRHEILLVQNQLNERDNRILSLTTAALEDQRVRWINSLAHLNYRNETEVEIKFVHTLLQFLGYSDTDTQIRVPITVQVGRQPVTGQADWVVIRSNGDKFVVEAKGPYQPIDEQVQDQARSYAFALRASIYVLTNGLTVQIFRRGITDDDCVLRCDVKHLAVYWKEIEDAIGKILAA